VIYPVGRALMAMMDTDAEARAAWENRMAAVRHGCAAAVARSRGMAILRPDLSPGTRDRPSGRASLSVSLWEHLTQTCGWSQEDYIAEITRLARRL
jgi:recombinational DNA repair ATPase RecF